ncbi:MAG TPA: O-antigen ligase family protein [Gemmataceae bacterium]|nr:O-antigen ligase family protein [Gemmataceae bacterium]
MLRRILLALITALIVARPVVLGEDPGLLNRLTSAWSLLFALLWFAAAVGWAAWRAWSGQTSWRGSAVEAGLLVLAALMWGSVVGAAQYKHPAVLVASEWVAVLVAFCLVRQLARTPGDNQGLLAAILASGVSISAFAIYQYTIEFPELRRTYGGDLGALLEAMAAQNLVANPRLLQQRLFENNVFATYAHPNSLAGYLALLFPLAIAWTAAARRNRPNEPRKPVPFFLAGACTLVVGLALWLTHSRGAILGTLLVATVILAAFSRTFLTVHKAACLAGLMLLLVFAVGISRTEWATSGLAKFWDSSAKRNDYWIATWAMIRHHPWLGVGPGNFGRLYPSYMLPRAFEQIKDPHNFVLEIWATAGVFALIALLITLGSFFRRTWPVLRSLGSVSGTELGGAPRGGPWIRWEFCVGGMVGLVLGFVLRALGQSPDEILLEGVYSAGRSLIWFAAFALFDRIPWTGNSRPLALAAGVAALLLNLLVSGGIAMPSVAQPLWVMAALVLNSLDSPSPMTGRAGWLPRMLPLPLLGGMGLAYFLLLFVPVVSCGTALSAARHYYPVWQIEVLPRWRGLINEETCSVARVFAGCTAGPLHPLPTLSQSIRAHAKLQREKAEMNFAADRFLKTRILEPLHRAVEADPVNSTAWLELAEWYGEEFKISPAPELAIAHALHCAQQAELVDPDNKDPHLFTYNLHVQIAHRFPQREKEEYGQAATAMRAAVERDLTNSRLRYQLAEALFSADLSVDGRRHAKAALELDEQSTKPERELTATQREQIRTWLNP